MADYLQRLIARMSGGADSPPLATPVRPASPRHSEPVADPFEAAEAPEFSAGQSQPASAPAPRPLAGEARPAEEAGRPRPEPGALPSARDTVRPPQTEPPQPLPRPAAALDSDQPALRGRTVRLSLPQPPEGPAHVAPSPPEAARPPQVHSAPANPQGQEAARWLSALSEAIEQANRSKQAVLQANGDSESPLLPPAAEPARRPEPARPELAAALPPPEPTRPVPSPAPPAPPQVTIGRLVVEVLPPPPSAPPSRLARSAPAAAAAAPAPAAPRSKLRFGLRQML